jgi:hypothetical protein
VGDIVQIAAASIYLASGAPPDEVYGLGDLQRIGAAFVRIAARIEKDRAELLANNLQTELRRNGIDTRIAAIYDE